MNRLQRARGFHEDLVALRRDLHRNPELSFQEYRTAAQVAARLEALGYRVRRGVGITGVVGELGTGGGPVVAVRADMDALPIHEEGEHEYRSQVPGVMHACGHDAHVAALVGAARLLAEDFRAGRLPPGTLRLLFQPSEERMDSEGKSGAQRMVEDGAMEGVAAVVGLHVGGHLPSGKVFVKEGPLMAGSDEVKVVVRGKSAHAALPHEGVDSLVLASQGILAVQQVVSRRISPMEHGVVTFGVVRGGVAPNVLAGEVTLSGTVRYFKGEVRERLHRGVREAFEGLRAQGAQVTVEFSQGNPPVVNHPAITALGREAALRLVGPEGVWEAEPMMGAEDFAILARQAPGAFFWVGAALPEPREHHTPRFDLDEEILPLAAALLAEWAAELLARFPETT